MKASTKRRRADPDRDRFPVYVGVLRDESGAVVWEHEHQYSRERAAQLTRTVDGDSALICAVRKMARRAVMGWR